MQHVSLLASLPFPHPSASSLTRGRRKLESEARCVCKASWRSEALCCDATLVSPLDACGRPAGIESVASFSPAPRTQQYGSTGGTVTVGRSSGWQQGGRATLSRVMGCRLRGVVTSRSDSAQQPLSRRVRQKSSASYPITFMHH